MMPAGSAVIVPADLTDAAQVEAAAKRVADELGGPDVLVNNAGVNLPRRYLHQLNPESIRALVDGNPDGALPHLGCGAAGHEGARRWADHPDRLHGGQADLLPLGAGLHGGEARLRRVVPGHQPGERYPQHPFDLHLPGEVDTPILRNRPVPVPEEELKRLLKPEDIAAMALFVATMPAHVCISEMLVTPTWMRSLASEAQRIAGMP